MYFQTVMQKTLFLNQFFVGVLKVNDEHSRIRIGIRIRIRIRIYYAEAWIRGSGSHQNVMDPHH
jgi:hypothetical protein